jgi:hypothetical protein
VATVGESTGLVTGVSGGSAEITALMPSVVAYNGDLCGEYGEPVPCPTASPDPEASGTVADATPVINSISPDYWLVGATTTGVIISGQHFGTSPIVNFSDPAVTCAQTGASDTLITCNITVGANASGGMVNVTVTSQGYNGSGFMPMPNGGSQATSNSYAADKQIPYILNAVNSGTETVCSGASCQLGITYQVLDTNANPINVAGMTVAETAGFAPGTPCEGNFNDAKTWQTNGTGTMTTPDYWWWCCNNGSCTFKFTQTFTVNGYKISVIKYNGYTGSHNVITIQCTSNDTSPCPVVVPTP